MRTNIVRSSVLLLVPLLFAVGCGPRNEAGTTLVTATPGPGPTPVSAGAAERVENVALPDGRTVSIRHGAAKDPAVAGCADGTREAFHDETTFPRIAGCMASWTGTHSLRAPRTGAACGDATGPCAAPTDACATGWHICGVSGALSDLRQVTGEQCEAAGGGRFSAAVSHCRTQSGCEFDMTPTATYDCFDSGWCSEPVCCGSDCGDFGACRGGVWTDRTPIPVGTDQGCGQTSADRAGGILCCKD